MRHITETSNHDDSDKSMMIVKCIRRYLSDRKALLEYKALHVESCNDCKAIKSNIVDAIQIPWNKHNMKASFLSPISDAIVKDNNLLSKYLDMYFELEPILKKYCEKKIHK